MKVLSLSTLKGLIDNKLIVQPKKLTQADKIRLVLQRKGRITSREMVNMGIFQYNARIKELRDDYGLTIVANRLKGSLFEFVLVETDK